MQERQEKRLCYYCDEKYENNIREDEKNKVENKQYGSCPTCFQEMQHGKMLTRFNKSFHNFSLEDKASFDRRENVTTQIKDPQDPSLFISIPKQFLFSLENKGSVGLVFIYLDSILFHFYFYLLAYIKQGECNGKDMKIILNEKKISLNSLNFASSPQVIRLKDLLGSNREWLCCGHGSSYKCWRVCLQDKVVK